MFPNLLRTHNYLVANFGPIFFFEFFRKKNSITSGSGFGPSGGLKTCGKNMEKINSSKINSNHYQLVYYVSGMLNIPFNRPKSLSSPFYGHFAKTIFFSILLVFDPVLQCKLAQNRTNRFSIGSQWVFIRSWVGFDPLKGHNTPPSTR